MRRGRAHVLERARGGEAVRALDGRAGQDRPVPSREPDDVRHLVLQAVRERAPVADDQRCAPGVRAEDVSQPAAAPGRIGVRAGQLVVLAGRDGEPGSVGGRVPGRPRVAELERILAAPWRARAAPACAGRGPGPPW